MGRLAPLVLLLASACERAGSPAWSTGPGVTSVSQTTSPTPDDSTSSGSSSGGGSSSTGGELSTGAGSGGASTGGTTLVFDVGTDKDLGPTQPPGCVGKIDFLFVISRWGGMEYYQAQLLDAFPKFIDTIEAKFSDFDYHIMVVDGDDLWGLVACDEQCPAQCVPDYPCDHTPTACDLTMGAGTVFPAGYNAANRPCKIDGGRRYMTKGQADLKDTFACAAQIGSSGDAMIGGALTAAVLPGINGPGGCNDGFLRDDALLMVTLISNTYDSPVKPFGSNGTPESWAAAVLKAKHDEPESIVMLSILDQGEPECHEKDRTCQMVKKFPHRLLVDRDEPDYGPAFEQATALVEVACADFIPPG